MCVLGRRVRTWGHSALGLIPHATSFFARATQSRARTRAARGLHASHRSGSERAAGTPDCLVSPPTDRPPPPPPTPHDATPQLSYAPYGAELLDPTDRTALARVEAVGTRARGGRREALAALRKALKEALRAERLQPSVRSKAGAVQVRSRWVY
jgi:hypothetical protein